MPNKDTQGPEAVNHISVEYAHKLLNMYPEPQHFIKPIMTDADWQKVHGVWAQRQVAEKVARDAGMTV